MTDPTPLSTDTSAEEPLSPSAAYADFKARAEFARTPLGRFMERTEFALDRKSVV